MSVEAAEAYERARKLGKKEASESAPLSVLDQILDGSQSYAQERVGTKEISLAKIVGTKSESRGGALGPDFLPLLKADSEFANKWIRLYDAQIEEGLRDPIKVYEYMHQYYVEEGNKRVSVMKYLNGSNIQADIIRILPPKDESEASRNYYAYLDFAHRHRIDFIELSQADDYKGLEKRLGLEPEELLSQEQERKFYNEYLLFSQAFQSIKKPTYRLTVGDAFLLYLEIYSGENFDEKSEEELKNELIQIQDDLASFPKRLEARLETAPLDKELKKRFFNFSQLKVGFIYSQDAKESAWTALHEEGQKYIQETMHDQIHAMGYYHADTLDSEIEKIEEAIRDGAQVIFTTSPTMLRSSIMMAAKYPKLQILNCSLNTQTGHLRTYFARNYEVQFLNGMIAGILADTNSIGYIADYPFYGMISNINAFALGAKMVNPQAKIYLDWSTTTHSMLKEEDRNQPDLTYIAGQEFNSSIRLAKTYGLYDIRNQKFMNLATRKYYWGEFYKQLLTSILNGSFRLIERKDSSSINYWWGLSNGMLDLFLSDKMPKQTKRLIEIMKEHMSEGVFNLFSTEIIDQEGTIRNAEGESMDLEEIANMDWLLDNVVGKIPKMKDFSEDAKDLIEQYGVYSIQEE